MSNLEPIEEADLDLKNKFIEDAAKINKPVEKNEEPAPFVLEKMPGRKEGEAEKEKAYSKILSKVKTAVQPSDDASVAIDAQSAVEPEGIEAKIETLIKLAMAKGVIHAVKVARHMEDNYALDEFHDRLMAEELHDALTKKGLIKEI